MPLQLFKDFLIFHRYKLFKRSNFFEYVTNSQRAVPLRGIARFRAIVRALNSNKFLRVQAANPQLSDLFAAHSNNPMFHFAKLIDHRSYEQTLNFDDIRPEDLHGKISRLVSPYQTG